MLYPAIWMTDAVQEKPGNVKAGRKKKAVLAAVIALAVIAIVLALIERARGSAMVNRVKDRLLVSGEILHVDKLKPEPFPDSENCRADLESLFEEMESLPSPRGPGVVWRFPAAMKIDKPGEGIVAWRQDRFADRDLIYDDSYDFGWNDLKGAIASTEPFLNKFADLTERKRFGSGIDYNGGFYGDLKFELYTKIRKFSRRVGMGALAAMREGDRDKAGRRLSMLFQLVRMTEDDRLILSQVVRMAFAQDALATLWELMAGEGWDDAQLAEMQNGCASLSFMKPMLAGFEMEMAMNVEEYRRYRESPEALREAIEMAGVMDDYFPGGGGLFHRSRAHLLLWRGLWSEHDEHQSLVHWEKLVKTFRAADKSWNSPETRKLVEALEGDDGSGMLDFSQPERPGWYDRSRFLFSGQVSFLSTQHLIRRGLRLEALKNLAVTAVALKRHRLRHGAYPGSLDKLVPEFLVTIPSDPMTDETLDYQRKNDGAFLLYSTGMNAIDDGGDATLPESGVDLDPLFDGKDILWPGYAPSK
jgi:hypothetical protein